MKKAKHGERKQPKGRGKTETRGERVVRWIEDKCLVPEGRDVGKPVILRSWQRTEILRIYDNPLGTRRAIISFGRKNGKTALAAFLLLVHLCGPENLPNSQLYSAAQSRDQAALLFGLAAKIVRMSPKLVDSVNVTDSLKRLNCPELGTMYRALSADATTAYGLSPAFIVHDELGQVKGAKSELYEALETATAAQENPLSIIISTQAPTDGDLLSVLIDDAAEGHDPRTVLSLHSAPQDCADPFGVEAIKAANPAFGDFQNSEEVLAMAADAKRMPSREPEYRNLVLNQRVEMNSPFISRSLWESCRGKIRDFGSEPVWGGLDLSEVRDLTALVLGANFDGVWNIRPTFWLPDFAIIERSRLDRVPYDVWAKGGFIQLVPGKSIEYEFVAKYLRDCFADLNIQKIAFDRWNWRHFKPWLLKVGFTEDEIEAHFVEFGQGFQSSSPAMRDLESAVLNGKLRHDGNPVMNMCAANAVVARDPAGNRKLNKAKSHGRIDGMSALVDFMGAVPAEMEIKPKPQYQVMVL